MPISTFCGLTEFRRNHQPGTVYQRAHDVLYQGNSDDRNRWFF